MPPVGSVWPLLGRYPGQAERRGVPGITYLDPEVAHLLGVPSEESKESYASTSSTGQTKLGSCWAPIGTPAAWVFGSTMPGQPIVIKTFKELTKGYVSHSNPLNLLLPAHGLPPSPLPCRL